MRLKRRLCGKCSVRCLALPTVFLVGQNWLISVHNHLETHQNTLFNDETKNQAFNCHIFGSSLPSLPLWVTLLLSQTTL